MAEFAASATKLPSENAGLEKTLEKDKKSLSGAEPETKQQNVDGDDDNDGDDDGDDEDEVNGEGDGTGASEGKKKKKKKKKNKKKKSAAVGSKLPCSRLLGGFTDYYVKYGQTEPPTKVVSDLFPSGQFPEGEIQPHGVTKKPVELSDSTKRVSDEEKR
jgi:methionyl aminopeptidase